MVQTHGRAHAPTAPFLDPRTGEWCFDASPLLRAYEADPFLLRLMGGFKGRAHLLGDVLDEVRGPAGGTIQIVGWCAREELILDEDRTLYAELRRRWNSKPGRDRGEAASIVAARRHGWILVIDERIGFQAALDLGVRVTRTTNLLVSTVRAGWWSADDAWAAYGRLLEFHRTQGSRPRLGPSLWNGRDEFVQLCGVPSLDPTA